MTTMWMVRAGRGGENAEDFRNFGLVAFGDALLGPLAPNVKKEQLLALYAKHYPSAKEGARASWASQLLRLATEVKAGDAVVTFDRETRLYIIGEVTGDYAWNTKAMPDKPHTRPVTWQHQVPRDVLSDGARNSLGSIMTLFRVSPEVAKELDTNKQPLGTTSSPPPPPTAVADEAAGDDLYAEMMEKADGFVEDAINALLWDQMQELVAGILRAMGYRTRVAPPGPDRGVDIYASPDGLGLQEPRIFVEVKHRTATVGADLIRSFLGGRKPGDRCLYVSTGGFTKEARYEADRAAVPLTLIDLPRLRELLVENYDKLDVVTRSMVPLKRMYWPVHP